MVKPATQVVKVSPVQEQEIAPEKAFFISWLTVLIADITVVDMPDTEVPIVQEAIGHFLRHLENSAHRIAKGGLAAEHTIDGDDIVRLVEFLREDRIEVRSVVVKSDA